LEVQQQFWLAREIITGSNFKQAVLLDTNASNEGHSAVASEALNLAGAYLDAIKAGDSGNSTRLASDLIRASKSQPMPELFQKALSKIDYELFYQSLNPFLWSGIIYFLLGLAFIVGLLKNKRANKIAIGFILGALALHTLGFGLRVYITGFAPVTNMYGTMIWMSFGVMIFGIFLHYLYQQRLVFGLLLIGSGLTLLLTESIPLILSPDMDPIVAVLRNNFWLSTHVLTVSISYAAFSIAMIIGNAGLILTLLDRLTPDLLKQLTHITYRAIQLGVFLLTTGIILGGWWADYSWGRFWGWDPKETWALIADIGFLAILHARYVGWLKDFGILATAPLAYLLVIMAWYGVNFILAAGLHSYGFSSGGATIVVSFVSFQLALLALTLFKMKRKLIHD
jgi:ABC-type transport system involved in cytochrome c biogenesis permease subunit